MITTHLSAVLLSHPKGATHAVQAKRGAERAERAETSNSSEIAAFSTMARRGGNRRKLAETPCRDFAREIIRSFAVSPKGCTPSLNTAIACGNCGNWFPPSPPVRSLRLDVGDLHVLRPLGALLAVLRRALLEAERPGVERELVDQPVVDRGRGDGLVDQRVQLLLDRPRRGLGDGDRQEAGAGEAGEGLAEGRQLGIERAARGQGDGERPRLVGD